MAKSSALRQLIEDDVSLTRQFNLSGGFADAANAVFSSASNSSASNVGQVSAAGLKPYTLEQKFDMLKRMIASGKVSLAAGVSLDTVKNEMKKPENDGLGLNELSSVLASKKLLKFGQAPKVQLKVATPTLSPRM